MAMKPTFDEVFDLAVATAGHLFEACGRDPHPGTDLIDFVEVCLTAQDDGRAREPNTCTMAAVAQAIPSMTTRVTDELVSAAREGLDLLTWFRSSKVPQDFVAQSCAAELVGPDGTYHSDRIRFGLFLIRAGADYPRHRHAAHENYLIIAGSGQWDVGAGWSTHEAGEIVSLPPHHPHALRTGDSAVLMLYTWTGTDIGFDTYEVG